MSPTQHKSVPAAFIHTAQERGDKIAMRHKEHGLWHEVSWNEYHRQAAYVAHGLMDLGIQSGDFVGIIGENCPEWLYMDMGIQMAGARTVGIYTTNAWKQVQYILGHSACRILFAENEEQVDKWLQMRDGLPGLEYVIYWDKKGLERLEDPQLMAYEDFVERGKTSFTKEPLLHQARVEKVQPDDISVLIYTSGTTGPPKGAMLTGGNILWMTEQLASYRDGLVWAGDDTMSFLPLCHIFERVFSTFLPLGIDYTINFAESPETIAQNLREIRPTVGYAVPRVWEKFQSRILIRMGDAPWLNRKVFQWSLRVGERYITKILDKERPGVWLRIARFLAFWTVFFPLRYITGMDRMRYALSGAAPISPKVLRFYHMLGVKMVEGYGMTETCAIISLSTSQEFKLGSVGKPIRGSEVRLSDEGEILVRHPGVIPGYYKYPEATAAALEDGWMHTGDIGEFDEEGFLRIVDRKKDLIITAGGKNIAPQKIENKLKSNIYINDAIVIGDKRKFLSAIIILDEDNINKYARDKKIQYTSYSDLATHSDIRQLIEKEVQNVNKELARVENIRKFTILDKRLYVEDGEVTPTMKVKRKFINHQYEELIEKMYA